MNIPSLAVSRRWSDGERPGHLRGLCGLLRPLQRPASCSTHFQSSKSAHGRRSYACLSAGRQEYPKSCFVVQWSEGERPGHLRGLCGLLRRSQRSASCPRHLQSSKSAHGRRSYARWSAGRHESPKSCCVRRRSEAERPGVLETPCGTLRRVQHSASCSPHFESSKSTHGRRSYAG